MAKKRIYSPLDKGMCTLNQTKDGCRQILEKTNVQIQVYANKLICVKRTEGVNFYKTLIPTIEKGDDGKIIRSSCPSGYLICGGQNPTDYQYQLCIKDAKKCPITDLIYKNQTLVKHTQSKKGYPLITLDMSESGAPCIIPTEQNHNPEKVDMFMIKKTYYEGCKTSIEDQSISPESRLVDGYPSVNELTVFKQNSGIYD